MTARVLATKKKNLFDKTKSVERFGIPERRKFENGDAQKLFVLWGSKGSKMMKQPEYTFYSLNKVYIIPRSYCRLPPLLDTTTLSLLSLEKKHSRTHKAFPH